MTKGLFALLASADVFTHCVSHHKAISGDREVAVVGPEKKRCQMCGLFVYKIEIQAELRGGKKLVKNIAMTPLRE